MIHRTVQRSDGTVEIHLADELVQALVTMEHHGVDIHAFPNGFTCEDAVRFAKELERPQ